MVPSKRSFHGSTGIKDIGGGLVFLVELRAHDKLHNGIFIAEFFVGSSSLTGQFSF